MSELRKALKRALEESRGMTKELLQAKKEISGRKNTYLDNRMRFLLLKIVFIMLQSVIILQSGKLNLLTRIHFRGLTK